jgi:hypothetical protein
MEWWQWVELTWLAPRTLQRSLVPYQRHDPEDEEDIRI